MGGIPSPEKAWDWTCKGYSRLNDVGTVILFDYRIRISG
jgi:hypothetical protein